MEGSILKVDSFVNHQMDPLLMKQAATEFMRRFADLKVNKILTIEASGIAPALMLGYLMELPVVCAKKKVPSTMSYYYQTEVRSFTKQRSYNVVINKEYLTADDHVLFLFSARFCLKKVICLKMKYMQFPQRAFWDTPFRCEG